MASGLTTQAKKQDKERDERYVLSMRKQSYRAVSTEDASLIKGKTDYKPTKREKVSSVKTWEAPFLHP